MRDIDCLDCKRTMRGTHDSAADFPGTVRHGGRGLCNACYLRHTRHGTIDQYTRPKSGRPAAGASECLTCKRAIRTRSASEADHPGTVQGEAGRCRSCHALHTQGREPQDIKRTIDGLEAYLSWRRPYRAKAGAPC